MGVIYFHWANVVYTCLALCAAALLLLPLGRPWQRFCDRRGIAAGHPIRKGRWVNLLMATMLLSGWGSYMAAFDIPFLVSPLPPTRFGASPPGTIRISLRSGQYCTGGCEEHPEVSRRLGSNIYSPSGSQEWQVGLLWSRFWCDMAVAGNLGTGRLRVIWTRPGLTGAWKISEAKLIVGSEKIDLATPSP